MKNPKKSPSELKSIRGFLFDIDKTLTDMQGNISDRTSSALRELSQKNYFLGVCTGRSYREIEDIVRDFPSKSFHILSAGAQVIDSQGSILDSHPLPTETAKALIELAQKDKIEFIMSSEKESFGSQKFVKNGFRALPAGKLPTVFHFAFYYLNNAFREAIRGFSGIDWNEMMSSTLKVPLLEITAKGINKSTGVVEWARLHGIQPAEIAGFGDSQNDLEFLDTVGWAVAMGNALPEVKERAQIVIGHTDEDGLAKYLEETWL